MIKFSEQKPELHKFVDLFYKVEGTDNYDSDLLYLYANPNELKYVGWQYADEWYCANLKNVLETNICNLSIYDEDGNLIHEELFDQMPDEEPLRKYITNFFGHDTTLESYGKFSMKGTLLNIDKDVFLTMPRHLDFTIKIKGVIHNGMITLADIVQVEKL
jgi:hypothetical protein